MNDREYYDRLASAYLRGRAERMSQEGPEIRAEGEKQEEKLYYFKRSPEKLPRVRMALGFLRSVWPESLLDVGSGRGAFLFPFLEEFPGTEVTAIDLLPRRVELLQDLVHRVGEREGLHTVEGDRDLNGQAPLPPGLEQVGLGDGGNVRGLHDGLDAVLDSSLVHLGLHDGLVGIVRHLRPPRCAGRTGT